MTVLITGGGLVGAQIIRLEQEHGRVPVLVDVAPDEQALGEWVDLGRCDMVRTSVTELDDVVGAVGRHGVTRIVHTAAHAGLTVGGTSEPLAAVRTNVLGTATVLEVGRLCGLKRVVICSSSSVHSALSGGVDGGDRTREDAYPRPSTVYAATKSAGEDLARAYSVTYGLDVTVVRFPAVFGPWACGGGGHATTLMESWVRAAVTGEPVVLNPPTEDWVYSKDAALGAWLACWKDDVAGFTFHIGMGDPYPAVRLRASFAESFPGTPLEIESSHRRPRANPLTLSIDRAKRLLGYEPGSPMPSALSDYAGWLSHHPPTLTPKERTR